MDTVIVRMPAVALRGMVILPGMIAHFDISREKSIKAVEKAMMEEQKIFLAAQKDVEQEEPGIDDLYQVGIIAEVKQVIKMQNNIVRILVEGKERAKLESFVETTEYLVAEVLRLEDDAEEELAPEVKEAMVRSLGETFQKYAAVNPRIGKEMQRQMSETKELDVLMDQMANNLPIYYEQKQRILEAVSLRCCLESF